MSWKDELRKKFGRQIDLGDVGKRWQWVDSRSFQDLEDFIEEQLGGSTKVVGNVKERFDQLKKKGFDWKGFYNGWIEGRVKMVEESKLNKKDE